MPSAKRSKFQVRSDAAKQRWVRDDVKEAFWRKHLEGWRNSGLSKRAYCQTKNLSESSFNAWSREIAIREREYAPTANVAALTNVAENPFVPIRLVHNDEVAQELEAQHTDTRSEIASQAEAVIEIVVPGGALLRVGQDCRIDFVSQLFSALKSEVSPC